MAKARFIAQRTLTGEFLHWELPLSGDHFTRDLSGPGVIEGTIDPALTVTTAADGLPIITEWDTTLYVEVDGEIRKGAMVTSLEWEGDTLTVSAAGYSTYPTGIPFTADYNKTVTNPADYPDPVEVVKMLWNHVQSYPDAALGVTVTGGPTWLRLGAGDGRAYHIDWWDVKDCGEEINTVLQTGPMDYLETHTWNSARTDVEHTITIGFPRIGRRRTDLRFAEGENIALRPHFVTDPDSYAQYLYAFGQGAGGAMVRTQKAVPNGRLRRAVTYFDKSADQARLNTEATTAFQKLTGGRTLAQVDVFDHPNAPIAGIQPGDDILIQASNPWLGNTALWMRVMSIDQSVSTLEKATLSLTRSDSFRYATATSPTGYPVEVDLGSSYIDTSGTSSAA